jgi:hypothetical protein
MRATEIIDQLTHLIDLHGDQEVYLDVSPDGLLEIGEIDVDADDTGIIVWPAGDGREAA